MSQFNLVKNQTNPDQIYFDLTVTNFQNLTAPPEPFYYNESRTLPFIDVPEDYYLSILRFTVETNTLPVFIPFIQTASQQGLAPSACDNQKTIYSVTLQYQDPLTSTIYTSQSFIKWEPQDLAAPAPSGLGTNGVQINEGGYYNCYNYQYFVYLILKALRQAFSGTPYGNLNASLSAQLAGAVPPVANPATYAPLVSWDTTSNTMSLTGENAYVLNQVGLTPVPPPGLQPINIFFNTALYGLFSSLSARYEGYNATLGRNFKLELVNDGGLNLTTITVPQSPPPVPPSVYATYQAFTMYQEYSTIENWTPILAIVFVSNTLPIQSSNVSTPLIFDNNQKVSLGGNNAATANVITDLVSDTGNYRPALVYLPQAQYRYITLYGNRPLYNLDLSIYYRIKTGELIPFRLQSGGSVTVKFGFIKKSSCQKV